MVAALHLGDPVWVHSRRNSGVGACGTTSRVQRPIVTGRSHLTLRSTAPIPREPARFYQRFQTHTSLGHLAWHVPGPTRSMPALFSKPPRTREESISWPHSRSIKIDDPQRPFPLQLAAARTGAVSDRRDLVPLVGGKDYAVTCFRFASDPETVIQEATDLALQWRALGNSFSERRHHYRGWGDVSLLRSARGHSPRRTRACSPSKLLRISQAVKHTYTRTLAGRAAPIRRSVLIFHQNRRQ